MNNYSIDEMLEAGADIVDYAKRLLDRTTKLYIEHRCSDSQMETALAFANVANQSQRRLIELHYQIIGRRIE